MTSKKQIILVAAAVALCASLAFAQKAPSPGTHLTVSKSGGEDAAMFTSIQRAVNAAQPGQVIEILDESEYEEQVTIEGRTAHPWGSGVVGGKDGITIRYVPSGSGTARPVIKHRDTQNVSPKTCREAKNPGDSLGTSGNFETNGAVRIIRASGITIEGIIIDGGGATPFGYNGIWDETPNCTGSGDSVYPLWHGNAAVAVAVSGSVQIRDCELRNAYFGIAVKDRNVGGVFGNPNPADNDFVIPLSGFGSTGNHLFEYNKIHDNSIGIWFESSWDLASTVRYNLLYSNYHKSTTNMQTTVAGTLDKPSGAIIFKDNYLSPVAIYNNTFYENYMHIGGQWQVGYQHLLFNNIFSKYYTPGTGYQATIGSLDILGKFPNRMKHCVMSGTQVQVDMQDGQQGQAPCPSEPYATSVQFGNAFQQMNNLVTHPQTCQYYTPQYVPVGQPIQASTQNQAPPFPSDANVRWLQTEGAGSGTKSLPVLFQSLTPTNANFLAPDWTRKEVQDFIRNKGWPTAGIVNEDGSIADLGAIPYSGKRPADGRQATSRVRISPFSVVKIINSGAQATASIIVNQEIGSLSNVSIKYIRWVAPVPRNVDSFGADGAVIPAGSIRSITGTLPTLSVGNNSVTFPLPSSTGGTPEYGFFEIVLEGKDGKGNTVTSDVGFLPYRQLDYELDIKVYANATSTTPLTSVTAGQQVVLRVTAINRSTGQRFNPSSGTSNPLAVEYTLFSDPAARMWQGISGNSGTNPLDSDDDLRTSSTPYTEDYTVHFTKAGDEIVSGAGYWCNGPCATASQRYAFEGALSLTVKPGEPDQVSFINPIPKSQIPAGALAPAISGNYAVEVQVQDRFGNAVNEAVTVNMRSEKPDVGNVTSPTSTTSTAGIAEFTATVINGKSGDVFDLIASIDRGSKQEDVASLRVGRASDNMVVYYTNVSNAGSPGNNAPKAWQTDQLAVDAISKNTGDKAQIWLKIIKSDTVFTGSTTAYACITANNPDLLLFSSEAGTGVSGATGINIPLTNGMGTFWVSADVDVTDAEVTASPRIGSGCDSNRDNAVNEGYRGNISFEKLKTSIKSAEVWSDNGNGQPSEVVIYYEDAGGTQTFDNGQLTPPESVGFRWPSACGDTVKVSGAGITNDGASTVRVAFNPSDFPSYYTDYIGTGSDLLTVYSGGDAPMSGITLAEKVGPLIAGDMAANTACGWPASSAPSLVENLRPGTDADELMIQVTETLAPSASLEGSTIMLKKPGAAGRGTAVVVTEATFVAPWYRLTIAPGSGIASGDSVSFSAAPSITDQRGNAPHADNRFVAIRQQEVPADPVYAWYTGNDAEGKPNYAYIVFNKAVTEESLASWFVGGSLKFAWADSSTYDIKDVGAITVMPENFATPPLPEGAVRASVIRIDLATAFPKSQTIANPITSGNMAITVTFGHPDGWGVKNITAQDKAAAVLLSALLKIGNIDDAGRETPDTLVLTYSEAMGATIESITNPARIALSQGGDVIEVDVAYLRRSTSGSGQEVVYIVNNIPSEVASGDWVWINPEGSVADAQGNIQSNPENRRVPLRLDRQVEWRIRIKNNPFKAGSGAEIILTPSAKGGSVDASARLTIYSNMGGIVIDTLVRAEPGRSNSDIVYQWTGRNKQGRTVGTGTYLLKAACISKESGAEDRFNIQRKIGFVRGGS
jgi:hypothetical protein